MSSSTTILRVLVRWSGWALVILILLVALLTVALRQLLPGISEYRDDIQSYLSERLRTEVTIGAIHASWEGRYPTLLIQDLKIADHRSRVVGQVSSDQIILGLNPVSSVMTMQPVLSKVEIWALKTDLQLRSPEPSAEPQDAPSFDASTAVDPLAALWLQPHIFFYDSEVDLILPSGAELRVTSERINLENSTGQHHFIGELEVEHQQRAAAAKLVIESDSHRFDPATNNIDFYFKLAGFDNHLLALGREVLPLPMQLEQLEFSSEFWGNWSEGRLRKLHGSLEADLFELVPEQPERQKLLVQDFSTGFALLQPEPDNYQLQLHDFTSLLNSKPLLLPELIVDYRQDRLHAVSSRYLDLAQLSALAIAQSRLPAEVVEALQQVDVTGEVHNLQISWPQSSSGDSQDWLNLSARADLQQLKVEAAYGAPGMSGIDGLLELDYDGQGIVGRVDLVSNNFGLFIPDIYKAGWQFSAARGVTHIRFVDDVLHLSSEYAQLSKPGINADGRWSLYLPMDRMQESELTLLIGVKDSDGSLAPELIPDFEVDPEIKRWVEASVKQGTVKQGGFLLHTETRDVPTRQSPTVQMFMDIDEAEVVYDQGWPAVSNARASLLLRDQGLEINVPDGRILNSTINHGWVYLPPGEQALKVIGTVSGDGSDIVTTLLNSPVMSSGGEEFNSWKVSGNAATNLDLTIPLKGGQEPAVDVASVLTDASLVSESRQLNFSSVNGRIAYQNAKGLHSEALTGILFGQPMQASIDTVGIGTKQHIRTRLNSSVDMDTLRKWSGIEQLKLAEGLQKYQAELAICTRTDCASLTLKSDLKDTQLSLMPPYSKARGSLMPLTVQTDFNAPQTIYISLADDLKAQLLVDNYVFRKGTLAFGTAPSLQRSTGLSVLGRIPQLDVEALIDLLQRAGVWGDNDSPASTTAEKTEVLAVSADVAVGGLKISGYVLENASLRLRREPAGWNLSVENPDSRGQISLPDQGLSQVKFDRLDLDALLASRQESEGAEDSQSDADNLKPGQLINLNVDISELLFKQKNWGRWQFALRNSDGQTRIEDISGQVGEMSIQGSLGWLPETAEQPDRSRLVLQLSDQKLAKTLETAGFEPILRSNNFKASLNLGWPGAPWAFELAETGGQAGFDIRDGQLVGAGSGTGFLRVFGILNMNAIGRRLQLDFADLFAKGISFDRMKGDYRIRQGVATTREPFIMRGPSVDMAITGDIDLVAETVDQQMAVTLPVTDNIPLAAVILGAPQVAGVAFLLDKLIGDEVKEKLATVSYTMKGDWSDPQVELLQQKQDSDAEKTGEVIIPGEGDAR